MFNHNNDPSTITDLDVHSDDSSNFDEDVLISNSRLLPGNSIPVV